MRLQSALVFLIVCMACGHAAAQSVAVARRQAAVDARLGGARVAVVAQDERGLTLEITGVRAGFAAASRDSAAGPDAAGQLLPLHYTIGIPFDAVDLRVEVRASHYDTLAVPAGLRTDRATPVGAWLGNRAVQRGLATVALAFQPARLEGGRIVLMRDARLTVTWRRSARAKDAGGLARAESPAMEEVMRAAVVNYDRARAWRRGAQQGATITRASGWGMEEAVVIRTGGDGAYSLEADFLAVGGVRDLLRSPIAALRLRNGSAPVRFHVVDRNGDGLLDGDDRLEFLGRRNPSTEPGFYYSDITDTNAYILTWHGGDAVAPLAVANGAEPAPEQPWYDSTLHIEEERAYFPGISDPESWGDVRTIHNSDRVPNERFYWARVTYPQQTVVRFVASPALTPGGNIHMRVRMAGATDTVHRVVLQINDIDVADVALQYFSDTTFEVDFPAAYLINGQNRLTLRPEAIAGVDPATRRVPDISYLDYIELAGRWLPYAGAGETKVRLPDAGGAMRRVAVAGFTAAPALAVSAGVRAVPDSVARGYTFQLTSRQLPPNLRISPGFLAVVGDSTFASPNFGLGIMMVEVDGANGKVVRRSFFNVYDGDQATQDANYLAAEQFIASVPDGNILLAGFSVGGGARGQISDGLRNALAALGSTRAGGNSFVASWAFAARKGQPGTATEAFARFDDNDRGVTLNAFIPDPNGNSYRAAISLPAAGDEFQIGGTTQALAGYHQADSLIAPDNRADMIVITHPGFASEAYRLAAHRAAYPPASGPFVVRVVSVNRIYDEFNNGVKDPIAIRRFLQYADSNWAAPSPAYVLLFGDASWDPQLRLPGSTTVDYIPTNGIPSTDFIYTVPFGDDSAYTWQQVIGRLPVAGLRDARAVVDKIIEYDTLPPALWNKRFVLLAGGGTIGEVDYHAGNNLELAETYVLSPNFLGDTALVRRTSDNLALPDDKDADWARGEVNKGTLWMNFSGHGATDVADLDYGFPEQFDNGNRYFMLATFSCQTGAFAEPTSQVRNERFVVYPGRGAIAAIGGTSFSFPFYDAAFKSLLFDAVTQPPYQRVLGNIFATAKYTAYFEPFKFGGWDVQQAGFIGRNSLFMYNLLGDPAMKLKVSRVPELLFANVAVTDVRGGLAPLPGDSVVRVTARLWNVGIPIAAGDSVAVVATITDRAQVASMDTVIVDTLSRYADIAFALPLGANPGEYTIRLQIDPAQHVPETYRRDNDTSFLLLVRGNQMQPIEPVPFGRVLGYNDIAIHLLNPASGPGADIEVDTTPRFDSPARFTNRDLGTTTLAELTTTWVFSMPQALRSARTFWWRAVATSGDTATARLFPLAESFTVDDTAGTEFMVRGEHQMARGELQNLVNRADGVGPGERPLPIAMNVFGQSFFRIDIPNPEIDINNRVNPNLASVFIDGRDYNRPAYDGINVVVMRGGRVLGPRAAFSIDRPGDADRFLAMMDTIAAGDRVVLWSNGQTFVFVNRGDELRAALRAVGMSDSVLAVLAQEDSYALIGGKGVPASEIRESWVKAAPRRAAGERPPYFAVLADTIQVPPGPGMLVSTTVGPATAWRSVRLDRSGTGRIAFTVIGLRRDGKRDTLYTVPDANIVSLVSIPTLTYPRLEFRADFNGDTTLRLHGFGVEYDPSPELAIVPSTLRLEADSVLQGTPGQLVGTIANLSRLRTANNVGARLLLLRDARTDVVDTLSIAVLEPQDSVRHVFTVNTDKLRGVQALRLEANPADMPAEPYRQNNALPASLKVGLDDRRPTIRIFADTRPLLSGDYVAPRPTFEIRIADNSDLRLDDSNAITLIVDNDVITLETPGTRFTAGNGSGGYRGSFLYTPETPLENGRHDLRVFTTDASGNTDTTDFIPFYVERDVTIRDVVNWPNPFVDKTTFTFTVTGGVPPERGQIAIYTVAGRKVRTIPLAATDINIGFNRVQWDGLDEDHDRMANGVYLYKVLIETGDVRQEVLDKLVIMR